MTAQPSRSCPVADYKLRATDDRAFFNEGAREEAWVLRTMLRVG